MHKNLNQQLIRENFRSFYKTTTSTSRKEQSLIDLILSSAQSHRLISQSIWTSPTCHNIQTLRSKSSQIRAKSIRSLHCHSHPFYRMTSKSIATECSQRHQYPYSTPMRVRMRRCCSTTTSRTTPAQMSHLLLMAA